MRRSSHWPRALALSAVLVACRQDSAPLPRWIDLARGFRPRPVVDLALELESALEPTRGGRIVRPGGGTTDEPWFELPLPRALWQGEADGVWSCPVPTGGALLAAEFGRAILLEEGRALRVSEARLLRPGHCSVNETTIRCAPAGRDGPGDGMVLRLPLDSGREVGGVWRAAQWDLACGGFLVFPGSAERLTCELPPRSRLGFATVAPNPSGRGAELAATLFRVRLDGQVLLEQREGFRSPLHHTWHWIDLDATGHHELTFEVEGPAPALFATPIVAPREIGTPGRRPWPGARPDLVLVLCDTFRADSLEAWGGPSTLAPHLNRFVTRSLRFLEARSVAAWTLPSIASLLSGVFPAQHGAVDMDRGVASEVETLAEVLKSAGYRTAAITDSGLFSRHYGQDQGFEWFEETSVATWNLGHTLARARERMAADDGRPLFLVVHTYRVHGPMRTGPDEDPGPSRELLRAVHDRLGERRASGRKVKPLEVALEFRDEGVAIYRDAVADLDRKLGAWIEELEGAGFLEHGALVLTSDHGEALGEHGQLGHGSDLYDVRLRVPLALAGRGIEPRAVRGPVSLIDVAPTLAALAGVAPSPAWIGRSLLGREPAGPLYAFDLKEQHRQVALYADGKKLMAPDLQALRAGTPSHAFDLAADPGEDQDLARAERWPAELSRSLADAVAPLLELATQAAEIELSPELRAQLEAIGYGE